MSEEIKSSDLLMAAKKKLAEDAPYICCNVGCAARELLGNYGHTKSLNIRRQIEEDLADTGDYASWYYIKFGRKVTEEEALEARLQWIDALIEYYQKQGD